MSDSDSATISVHGLTQVSVRPSQLLLLGRVQASGTTLELALQQLSQKRSAVERWLRTLSADVVEIDEPRFPEQVEPSPMQLASRSAARYAAKIPSGGRSAGHGERNVVVFYWAKWSISQLTSEEILVLVDRIQFEASEMQKPEQEVQMPSLEDWEANPMGELEAVVSQLSPSADDDPTHILFLSTLDDESHDRAVQAAIADGEQRAKRLAAAAGRALGPLQSIFGVTVEKDDLGGASEIHRRAFTPLVNEVPDLVGAHQMLRESQRKAGFRVTVRLTYRLD
jgi:hypothetical protein